MRNSNSRTAAGVINPFRFVMSGAVASASVTNPSANQGILLALQCTGGTSPPIGIGAEWTSAMSGTQTQLSFVPQNYPAASVNQQIRVYEDGESTMLCVGSGYIVEPDDLLMSDASGNGIPYRYASASSGFVWIGARALEYGFPGDPIAVQVYTRPLTKP